MKINNCRSCNSILPKKIFSLGKMFYTGMFPLKSSDKIPSGNLSLVMCKKCKLLQLDSSFNSKKMFGVGYGYKSSANKSMVNHLKSKKEFLVKKYKIRNSDLVIDIGSNDGTFLNFFQNKSRLYGIDPSAKNFRDNYKKGINVIEEFFNKKLINKNFFKKKAKLVTSISMFYDLDDPINFSKNIYEILDDDGVWHLEQSYMPFMIDKLSYDTICHEHLEYYSLKSIIYIFNKTRFLIKDIKFNNINGGSFAITLKKRKFKSEKHANITYKILMNEQKKSYNTVNKINNFFKEIKIHKKRIIELLNNLQKDKKRVFGYGASTKGNVLLQFCKLNQDHLSYIAEVTSSKFNKFTPGTKIKILSEKITNKMKPDYYFVLPWHFKKFIISKEKNFLKSGGKLIFPLPKIKIVKQK